MINGPYYISISLSLYFSILEGQICILELSYHCPFGFLFKNTVLEFYRSKNQHFFVFLYSKSKSNGLKIIIFLLSEGVRSWRWKKYNWLEHWPFIWKTESALFRTKLKLIAFLRLLYRTCIQGMGINSWNNT